MAGKVSQLQKAIDALQADIDAYVLNYETELAAKRQTGTCGALI